LSVPSHSSESRSRITNLAWDRTTDTAEAQLVPWGRAVFQSFDMPVGP